MFDFERAIKTGMESATKVKESKLSIDAVFAEVNRQIKDVAKKDFKISYEINSLVEFVASMVNQKGKKQEDKGIANGEILISQKGNKLNIGSWIQSPNGYPFTIIFSQKRVDCLDQQSLVEAMDEILSSAHFWIKVEQLEKACGVRSST